MTPTPSTGQEIVRQARLAPLMRFTGRDIVAVWEATLARPDSGGGELREALEFYRDNWSVDDTWNPKGGSYPNSALRSDGGQRARQALVSLARDDASDCAERVGEGQNPNEQRDRPVLPEQGGK